MNETKEIPCSTTTVDGEDWQDDEELSGDTTEVKRDSYLHCIACCSASGVDNDSLQGDIGTVIKTESDITDGDIQDSDSPQFISLNKTGSKRKLDDEKDDKRQFFEFCGLLGIKLTAGLEVDDNTTTELSLFVPPFCATCKNQLTLLIDLQEKLKDIQRDLENGIREFKEMCQKAEDKFERDEVYATDKIYLAVRKQLKGQSIRDAQSQSFTETSSSSHVQQPTRASTRSSRKPTLRKSHASTEEDVCIKVEPEISLFKDVQEEEDNIDPLDDLSSFSPVENNPSSDEYQPPKRKKSIANKRKRVGRPPIKLKKSSSKTKAHSKSVPKKTVRTASKRGKKEDTCYVPCDNEDDGGDSDDDIESSLKGRMSTDPKTGHVTFLQVSFEALDSGRYRCLTCKKDSAYHRGSLKKHVITMHTEMFVCQECDQHCPSSKSLHSHIRRVHRGEDRKTVSCPVCGKPCSSKRGRMEKHMGTHMSAQEKEEAKARGEEIPQWSKNRRHVCEECGRGYELRSHLIQHKIREHPSTDYTEEEKVACKEMCPDCGKLVHRHYLKKHQEFVHSEGLQKRFSCMLCEKRFAKESDLRKHKNVVHEKIKPFKCSLCPKQFALKTQLNYHIDTHQNIRPYQCDHCPMAFARKHHLERHLRIYHEPGAKPKRKTYVKGPETKIKSEEMVSRKMNEGQIERVANSHSSLSPESSVVPRSPLGLDMQHHQQIAWLGSAS